VERTKEKWSRKESVEEKKRDDGSVKGVKRGGQQ